MTTGARVSVRPRAHRILTVGLGVNNQEKLFDYVNYKCTFSAMQL